jgi:hypothetical protein
MRKVIVIALLVTSCTSQVKPQASITPSSLPVTTTTTAALAKYPPEAIANYIDVCTKGGVSKKSCGCFIEKAQNVYPLDELIKINNSGTETPAKINEILAACDDKPKATVAASPVPTLAPAIKTTNTKPTTQDLTPVVSATHTFPDWLIKDDAETAKLHETGTKHTDKDSNWIYDNRFIYQFRDYPYTASATNHAEWLYVDCFSGWKYYKNYPFVKDSREYATAPNDESINKAVPQRLEGLRSLCNRMGVSPRF